MRAFCHCTHEQYHIRMPDSFHDCNLSEEFLQLSFTDILVSKHLYCNIRTMPVSAINRAEGTSAYAFLELELLP
uniref:Uncharacterized protein n=1 Tax=Arundo donax TaxID=35708 RepID=A0A0A9CRJ5_ARUDO